MWLRENKTESFSKIVYCFNVSTAL